MYNNVPQGEIAKNWNISPCTVYNIINRFQDLVKSLFSLNKEENQYWKPAMSLNYS